MQTATTLKRWLMILFIAIGVTGTAYGQRTVTLRLNTSTLPDTLRTTDEIQIRGQLGSGTALPDGGIIDWNDATTLKPTNVGGDYWDITFQIPDDDALQLKFYSQGAEDHQIGGWEDGDNAQFAAGTGAVDGGLHYFNKSGSARDYNFSPFASKADSVGVMFRVWANTEAANTSGYKGDGTDAVGVRGDPMNGASMLDWGSTKVVLNRESETAAAPGYHMYSGMAWYPTSAVGTEQAFKFFVEPSGWEADFNGGNRTFKVPAADSTLHWVFFSESKPLNKKPVAGDAVFSVDLSMLERINVFSRSRGDTLQVRGSFNGWGCGDPDKCLLFKQFGLPVFDAVLPLTLLPGVELEYKYFIDFNVPEVQAQWATTVIPSGWEEPLSTQGGNRKQVWEGGRQTFNQTYNDIFPKNIIPAGTSIDVTFSVDMTSALTAAQPFDPAVDSVTVGFQDPIFSLTQGFPLTPRSDDPNLGDALNLGEFARTFSLTDADGDMVYTGTLKVSGPTYSGMQYKYSYGSPSTNTFTDEQGGSTSGGGRRRTRFVPQNADGSWPTAWFFRSESFQAEGALPFDGNPAVVTGIEALGGELPTQVSLTQNFPNPFNPTTTFEYAITKTTDVQVKIYDMLGRVVATLVDGVQPASTYRLSFDASNLASGTYIYRLKAADQVITKTMVLLK